MSRGKNTVHINKTSHF